MFTNFLGLLKLYFIKKEKKNGLATKLDSGNATDIK